MAGPPLHDRLYRALLKLFPREFRGDFGDQMVDDFRDQREDAAVSGRVAGVRLWTRTVVDTLHRAPREHLDILRRDAGYALRLFRRRPGMTASALLTLTIGIGLTAAVFSVAYGVLWQPLALPDSERLVWVSEAGPPPERRDRSVSQASFDAWERDTQAFDGLASLRVTGATLLRESGAEQVMGAQVSARFFAVLGARPQLGRLFTDADFVTVLAPKPAIIAHGLWIRQFGGRPDAVGERVSLGRSGEVEIVGVLRPDFEFPLYRNAAIVLPDLPTGGPYAPPMMAIGRLTPGATRESAQAELDVVARRLAATAADPAKAPGARVTLLRDRVAASARTQLWFLLGTATCVLLIACANVSNLLLAHATGRRRELATRAALGATRAHLVRQALTEGFVLALAGGLAGVLLASWSLPALIALAPRSIPRLDEVSVGWPVLAFATATSVCVGLACGLAASLTAGRSELGLTLRSQRTAGPSGGSRFRQGLIAAQVAVALMLAVAAGLLGQTLRAVTALPLGYDPANVISIAFSPSELELTGTTAKAAFEHELLEAIRAVDGVTAAGVGTRPLSTGYFGTAVALAAGSAEDVSIRVDPVGPGYLEALGARLVTGRFFDDRDGPGAPRVALVNESAARLHWQGGAVAQTFRHQEQLVLVVGVLGDFRRTGLEAEPEPTFYFPSAQTVNFWVNNLLVRTDRDPRELLPAIQAVVRQVERRLPVTYVTTLAEGLDVALAPRRFNLWLVSLFSLIALAVAVVGIYGVLAEAVAQRVPEIGVRMALGATAGRVTRMFLRQGGWMIAIGIAVGSAAALGLSGVMASFVFGVPTTDPVSFGVAVLAVAVAGLLACAIPARRASRVDPVIALRQE
jgi:putative ABC transport system permease protein